MDHTRRVPSDFNGGGGGAGRRQRTLRQGLQLAGRMFTDCVEESTYFDILLCTAIFIIFTCFFFWLGIRFGTALIPEDDMVLLRARRTAVKVEPLKTNPGLLQALGYRGDGKGDKKQVQGVKSDALYISQDSQVKMLSLKQFFLCLFLLIFFTGLSCLLYCRVLLNWFIFPTLFPLIFFFLFWFPFSIGFSSLCFFSSGFSSSLVSFLS